MKGAILDGSLSRLLELGLPGVVIVALAFVVWKLYKDNLKLQDKIDAIQEKRIECATDSIKALSNSSAALEILTDTIRDRRAGVA